MSEWWAGLAPAEALIECNGADHRLRWAEGALETLDHGDPESERALAAIGATPCPCIETLDAWTAHATDLRVLTLAPRGPFEGLVPVQLGRGRVVGFNASPAARGIGQGATRGLVRSAGGMATGAQAGGRTVYRGVRPMRPGGPVAGSPVPQQPDTEPLIRLLYLGSSLPDRLIATVVAHWSARLAAAEAGAGGEDLGWARPALTAALYGRAASAVRAWLRDDELRVTVTMIDGQTAPSLTRTSEGVALSLPFSWLPQVWSPGLATVLDRFCLSATMAIEGGRIRWQLTTVGPAGDDVAPVTIEGPAR